jgi:hypothetical protein
VRRKCGVGRDSATEWKGTSSEQFEEMILFRLGEKEMHVSCDVVEKDGYKKVTIACNSSHFESSTVVTSGVVNAEHIEG